MGMFDTLYDADGNDWQTKAFGCILDQYAIGDRIDGAPLADFQVEVCGGEGPFIDSLATVRGGKLKAVPVERDESLPHMNYHGYIKLPDGTERRSRER